MELFEKIKQVIEWANSFDTMLHREQLKDHGCLSGVQLQDANLTGNLISSNIYFFKRLSSSCGSSRSTQAAL